MGGSLPAWHATNPITCSVSVLALFEYTALVWATIIGYDIWLDFTSIEVWIGAAIINGCGRYVIHRESLQHITRIVSRE